jgi:hypothetical protein
MKWDPELDPDSDPVVRFTDPRIRIRTKRSRIPHTAPTIPKDLTSFAHLDGNGGVAWRSLPAARRRVFVHAPRFTPTLPLLRRRRAARLRLIFAAGRRRCRWRRAHDWRQAARRWRHQPLRGLAGRSAPLVERTFRGDLRNPLQGASASGGFHSVFVEPARQI